MLGFIAGVANSIWRITAFVVVAPILIAVLVLATTDGDAFKARMIEELARHMGVDVRVNGPVDVNWGWPPSITLSDVQLAHTNNAGVDIITIDELRTDFDVLSLVTGQLQPSHLRLHGVDIVMRPDALLEAAAGLEAATAPAAGPLAAAAPALGLSSMGTAVGAAGVSIAGASVTLVDPSTGRATTVDLIGDDTETTIGDGSGGGDGGGNGSGDGGNGSGDGGDGSGGDGGSGCGCP